MTQVSFLKALQEVKLLLGLSDYNGGPQGPGEIIRDLDAKEFEA